MTNLSQLIITSFSSPGFCHSSESTILSATLLINMETILGEVLLFYFICTVFLNDGQEPSASKYCLYYNYSQNCFKTIDQYLIRISKISQTKQNSILQNFVSYHTVSLLLHVSVSYYHVPYIQSKPRSPILILVITSPPTFSTSVSFISCSSKYILHLSTFDFLHN